MDNRNRNSQLPQTASIMESPCYTVDGLKQPADAKPQSTGSRVGVIVSNAPVASLKRRRSFTDPSETVYLPVDVKDNDNGNNYLRLVQGVKDALRYGLQAEDTAEYWEAVRRDPVMVERESNVAAYLRYENNNIQQTAVRLASYWKQRVAYFQERAFLPLLDLSGKGALDDTDIEFMKSAWIVPLPNDSAGRSVFCLDKTRQTFGREGGTYMKRLKLWFFWVQIAGMKSEIGEMCLIRVVDDLSIDKKSMRRTVEFIDSSFPVRMSSNHICCTVPDSDDNATIASNGTGTARPNKNKILAQLAAPIVAACFKEALPHESVVTHVASSPAEMLDKLLATGQFQDAECLPTQTGGTWGIPKFNAWFSHRVRSGFAYAWNTQTSTTTTTLLNLKSSGLEALVAPPPLVKRQRTAANRLAGRKQLKGKLDAVFARTFRDRKTHQGNPQDTVTTSACGLSRGVTATSRDTFMMNTRRAGIV